MRKLKSNLSTNGIQNLIAELNTYTLDLTMYCDELVKRLAEEGIRVAIYHVYSEFEPYVEFDYESTGIGEGRLIGKSTKLIHRVWYKKNGNDISGEYDISPILMAEFGAGWYASTNPWDSVGSTRGTLGKNGNRDEWFWYDESGVKHSSNEDYTMNPTRPMYNAFLEMMEKVYTIAKEVFHE